MQNFNSVMEQKKNDLDKIKRETSIIEKRLQTDMKIKSQLLEELGKLKADHDNYKKLIARRDSKLKSLRQNLGLGDFGFDDEDEPLVESQVSSILQQLKQRNEASQKEFANCKTKHENLESEIQSNIEKKHIEKAQKQQKLITSNEQMAKNKTAIRNIKEEISRIDSLSSQQDILEGDLKEAEDELKNLEGRVNVDDLRNQLSEKQNKRNGIESQLSALNREINELHKENQTRTEIDIVKKDICSKQEAINKILSRHRETIVHLLQELPEDGIHEKLTTLMNSLNQKIQKMNKDLEKERGLLSSLETTKEFHKSQLLAKEETLSENQKKIFDVCGSQDYDYNITSLKNMIKELQDEKGALTGSLYLYNKYVEKLEKPRPCCPLCTRAFQAEEEAQSLIKDLQRKLQSVPATLDQKTKLIASKEKILSQMLELKPIKETASVLAEKEIPELKKKIEAVTADITKSTSKINELEEVLDDINSDLKTASNIIPDVIQIGQTQREIERLTRNLTFLKSQIANKDLSRNVQQAVEEQNSLQQEVKRIAQEIDLIQQKINDFREQVQVLKGRINDLKAKKIKMYTDLQKKSSLIEQHETLIKENSHLAE
ncbi:DNA repair protein RAD50, partial [Stegodyphus mimosarum]